MVRTGNEPQLSDGLTGLEPELGGNRREMSIKPVVSPNARYYAYDRQVSELPSAFRRWRLLGFVGIPAEAVRQRIDELTNDHG